MNEEIRSGEGIRAVMNTSNFSITFSQRDFEAALIDLTDYESTGSSSEYIIHTGAAGAQAFHKAMESYANVTNDINKMLMFGNRTETVLKTRTQVFKQYLIV